MKRALLSTLALLFLAFFLMPAKANAHGLEEHVSSTQSASQKADALYDKAAYTFVKAIPAENIDQDKSCDGQCCSNAACCAAILCHVDSTKPQPLRSLVSPMALSGLAPLGPPYPLFRPPRQIV